MEYTVFHSEIVGDVFVVAEGGVLVCCFFAPRSGSSMAPVRLPEGAERRDDSPVLIAAREWLARYFAGECPDVGELPLAPASTVFQERVRRVMLGIPAGQTLTYGEIAAKLAAESGGRVSAQAVGCAVGRNPLWILVPCHRVVGASRALTGYAGGLDNKAALLRHEGAHFTR